MTKQIDILILVLIGLFLITIQPTTANAENQEKVIYLTNALDFKDIKYSYFGVGGISTGKEKLARKSLLITPSSSTYKVVEMPRIGSSEKLKFYRSTANIKFAEIDYLNGWVAVESPESNTLDWWIESPKGTFIKPFMSEKGSVFGYLSRVEGHGISVSIDLDDDGIVDIFEIIRDDSSVESWIKEDGPAISVLEDLLMGKEFCSAINSLDEINTLGGTNPSSNPFFNVKGPSFNPFNFCSRHNDNERSPIIIGGGGVDTGSGNSLFDLSDKCKTTLSRAGVTTSGFGDQFEKISNPAAAVGGAFLTGWSIGKIIDEATGASDAIGKALGPNIDKAPHQGTVDPNGSTVEEHTRRNPHTGEEYTHIKITPPSSDENGDESSPHSPNESPVPDPNGENSPTWEQMEVMRCKRQAKTLAARGFVGPAIEEKCPNPAETNQDQIVLQTYCNASQKDNIDSLNGLIWRDNTACGPTEYPDENGNCSGWGPVLDTNGEAAIAGFGVTALNICDPQVCDPYLGVDAVVETNLGVNVDFGTNLHNFILDNRNLPALFNVIEQR